MILLLPSTSLLPSYSTAINIGYLNGLLNMYCFVGYDFCKEVLG